MNFRIKIYSLFHFTLNPGWSMIFNYTSSFPSFSLNSRLSFCLSHVIIDVSTWQEKNNKISAKLNSSLAYHKILMIDILEWGI